MISLENSVMSKQYRNQLYSSWVFLHQPGWIYIVCNFQNLNKLLSGFWNKHVNEEGSFGIWGILNLSTMHSWPEHFFIQKKKKKIRAGLPLTHRSWLNVPKKINKNLMSREKSPASWGFCHLVITLCKETLASNLWVSERMPPHTAGRLKGQQIWCVSGRLNLIFVTCHPLFLIKTWGAGAQPTLTLKHCLYLSPWS